MSVTVIPEPGLLGARIAGVDVAQPLDEEAFRTILRALGRHGVLCFPGQDVPPAALAAFGARFGELEINVANSFPADGHPEVMILSNMVENGRPAGLADAGQGWHTDMSYSRDIALANILHARRVPMRDGQPLGDTQFLDMHRAYEELPDAVKERIAGLSAVHDFAKFWDMMRARPGSTRAPLTARQRASRPPVTQPLVRVHPITDRKVLYCNPGYATRIEGLPHREGDELLDFLFRHQSQRRFLHVHRWRVGDVLMWDDIGTTHNAVADYRADEPRFMYRVQVMATRDYAALV